MYDKIVTFEEYKHVHLSIAAKDIIDIWGKLWTQYKNFSRLQKTYKSGDGAKKGLNQMQQSFMDKMQYFEPYVIDVTSNIHSTIQKTNGISQPNKKNSSSTQCTSHSQNSNAKVPPPEKHWFAREEKKQKLSNIVQKLSSSIESMSEQTQELIKQQNVPPSNVPTTQNSDSSIRSSYLKIINSYFQDLNPEERSACLLDMLAAVQAL